ncbi:MAG: MATE family efflux transporter [Dehalococcoidales bacterium]|nr:MAG: MATE family efflux transporter [Dehalococcoidales bacterium]
MKRPSYDRDWTEGSVIQNLWSLSWPIMISQTLTVLGPTIDMIWVGKLGAAPIAGVGVSGMVVMAVNSVMMGLYTGLRAMIARFVGSGDTDGANTIGQQALVIGTLFSAIMAAIGIFLAEPLLSVFGVEPDVVAEGAAYLRIQLAGSITMALTMVSQSIMQASGDTVTPMRISIFFRLLQIVVCPLFVFGLWIFPNMGVSGAAWANVISQFFGASFGIWFLFTGRTRLKLTLRGFRLDKDVIWRLTKIGVPASITGVQRFLPYLVLVWFVSPFGTAAVGALSLIQRIDTFIRMPAGALGSAAGVLAGQNLGAGKPERAEKGGWIAVVLFSGVMVICCIFIWFFAENIVKIFSTDAELVEITSTFMRIQIVGYLVFGLTIVISLCVEGVGDTMITMIVTLLTMWVIQIPLAWFLPKYTSLGVNGVQWAISIALVFRAFLFAIYFKSGRWKRKMI